WMLDPAKLGNPEEPGRLKLGSGKPLGFGSVEVTVEPSGTRLSRGQDVSDRLRSLQAKVQPRDWTLLAGQFERGMPPWFDQVKQAIRAAAVGYPADVPVHYPRTEPRSPGYEWFKQNEDGRTHHSLPLVGGEPLPCKP